MTFKDRTEQASILLNRIAEDFPNTFLKPGQDARPLKIGIFKDLVNHYADRLESMGFADEKTFKEVMKVTMCMYCRSYRYYHAVLLGVERIDLEGMDAGKPTENHIKSAEQSMERHIKRRADQKKKRQLAALKEHEKKKEAERQAKLEQIKAAQAAKVIEEAKQQKNPESITAETLGMPKLSLKRKKNVAIASDNTLFLAGIQ